MVQTNSTDFDTETFDLSTYLSDRRQLVEAALDQTLPVNYPENLYESMRYSLLAGGKRLRPILCLATCELLGGDIANGLAQLLLRGCDIQ